MTDRWVRATSSDAPSDGPIWINMGLITHMTSGPDGATLLFMMDGADFGVMEPPEHFLPRPDLAYCRLVDALAQIKALRQFGEHGAIDIAEKALERWRTDL